MKTRFHVLSLLLWLLLMSNCKKSGKDSCEGVLNESPPRTVGIFFANEMTAERLIPKAEAITITYASSGENFSNWRVVTQPGSPLYGMIELLVFEEAVGDYAYSIAINDAEPITISYSMLKQTSDNPCKPFNYPVYNLRSLTHPYVPLPSGEGTVANRVLISVTL